MYSRKFNALLFAAAVASAQTAPQHAAMVGGGNPNSGQCTVQVLVDGTAEFEIRGADATLRDIGGAPPQWRRFECTSAMPPNPANFQFAGLNGRGHQNLVAEPRNGGPAVIRIEDPDGGAAEYTFRLTWNGNGGGNPAGQDRGPVGARDDRGFQGDRDRQMDRDGNRQYDRDRPGDRDRQLDRDRQRGRDQDEAYYRDRDNFFRGNGGRPMLFQRVREDLNHATSGAFPFTGDRARLDRTQRELDELQQKLSQGIYDERELDEVVGALQAVVQGNRLDPRDRAMLGDDLDRMRDFRARHDQFGARAAVGGDRRNFDPDRDRDRRPEAQNGRAMFFQRIREDLDRATAGATSDGGDQERLARTRYELNELQSKMSQGIYDERELDEVMGALQRVVDSNRLAPRERDALAGDLSQMHDFRLRHEQYGAR